MSEYEEVCIIIQDSLCEAGFNVEGFGAGAGFSVEKNGKVVVIEVFGS